jgi:hypothetical protein
MKRSLIIALAAGVLGCVDRGPGPHGKKIEPRYIRENLLDSAPPDVDRLDVEVGGKLIYLGSKLAHRDGRALAPGQPIRIYHYWQVKEPPGDRWRVFAHVRGAEGSADFMNLRATDMQLGHPPSKWKAGQIIQDVQDFVLRPDWRSPSATLLVGLVEQGRHQLGDRMAASGPHVRDRAIVARTIEIDLAKAPPPPGTIYVPRAAGPITIDGVASDPGWASAVTSPELVTAEGSPEPAGKAIARMTWDDDYLYVFVQVTDTDVFSPYKQKDDPLWKADCVELFIDADGNKRGYVELQVNPNNATFDSWFAGTRAQPGDEAWDSGMITAVNMRGTADRGGDADQGWDVEIAIPLAAVKGRDEAMAVRLPPEVGDRWRLNVVRVDHRSSGGNPSASSWNRITYADFHALDRMLTVVFADATGSIVARPAPEPVAPDPPADPASASRPVPEPTPTSAPQGQGTTMRPLLPAQPVPPAPAAPQSPPAPAAPRP